MIHAEPGSSSVLPLLVARSLTLSFINPFRRAQAENDAGQITIQVKWGRDRSVQRKAVR